MTPRWELLEALFFFAVVMLYMWLVMERAPAAIVVLVCLILVSWRYHRETIESLGLSFDRLCNAFVEWRWAWLVVCVALLWTNGRHLFSWNAVSRGLLYFVWCIVQQLALQSMITMRIQNGLGRRWLTAMISGALFGLVHLPNPVLVPLTVAWGALSSLLFLSYRSTLALAGMQVCLSAIAFALTPVALNHGFRVGPTY